MTSIRLSNTSDTSPSRRSIRGQAADDWRWPSSPPDAALHLERALPLFRDGTRFVLENVVESDASARADVRVSWCLRARDRSSGERHAFRLTALRVPTGRHRRALERLYQGAVKPRITSVDPRLLIVEHRGWLLFPFPLDPALRRLVRAADPKAATRRMVPQLARLGGAPPFKVVDVHVERYVPGKRCQLRYELHDRYGARVTVFGKVYRDDRGARIADQMQAVSNQLAAQADGLVQAPGVLAYLDDWRMLVQQAVPGRTLHELLRDRLATARHFARTGVALAKLHETAFPAATGHGPAEEIAIVRGFLTSLVTGETSRRVTAALRHLERQAAMLTLGPSVPLHRDFHDKQVLLDGDRVSIIDLDTLDSGRPEVDVANFLAHVLLRQFQGLCSANDAAHVRASFVAAYRSSARQALDRVTVSFYLATSLLRLACLYRLRQGDGSLVRSLLDHAQRTCGAATPTGPWLFDLLREGRVDG